MNDQLSKKMMRDIFRTILLLSVLMTLVVGAFYLVYHDNIWYSEDVTYLIAQFIKRYIIVSYLLVWAVTALIIMYRYWKKSLEYLADMTIAGKKVASMDEEMIHLPEELREIEDQLNQAKNESIKNARLAKESEQRKNDLIVYLAHDLKTPLTSVVGYLTLLHDEQQISPELREKYLGISLDRAEHLEDLINEFFEITRFNLSNLTLDCSQLNLTRMLEQIAFEFEPLFQEKQISCKLEIQQELSLRCDVEKMERVFDNLLRNAVNYSYENGTITIKAQEKEEGIEIVFSNTGNTIPKEKLARIFEQFFRLDTARSSNSGGAGLGLAIAKEIIELHQGTITAESENEQIIFKIWLPLSL